MKNIVGTPARGSNFFQRDSQVAAITKRIADGNNLQIAAPRRVGKTSILFYLQDNEIHNHVYVYVDTERVDSEQDYYKKLLKEILKNETITHSTRLKKVFEDGKSILKKVKSIHILGQGIDFKEDETILNYYEELSNFLQGIALEDNRTLVLLIDEFPQTILNIIDANDGDARHAKQFLQSNRELRLDPEINNKVRFIYTGSIGLNHTVAAIDATAFVNDLNSIEIGPLSHQEAMSFLGTLLTEKEIKLAEAAQLYLLKKIQWLIPFHIQLAVQEIDNIANKEADHHTIDQAFDNMVQRKNNNHFEHYHSRLKMEFKKERLLYAVEALKLIAVQGTLTKASLYDCAIKFKAEQSYRTVMDILEYDGYINNNNHPDVYEFNSPVLRMWWQKFIC